MLGWVFARPFSYEIVDFLRFTRTRTPAAAARGRGQNCGGSSHTAVGEGPVNITAGLLRAIARVRVIPSLRDRKNFTISLRNGCRQDRPLGENSGVVVDEKGRAQLVT